MTPRYQVCEPLTPDEYEALKASIKEHGVRVPVDVDEEGNILDGHNRAAIALELKIPCPTAVKPGLETDESKRMYARGMNCARRQMTPEKKRKVVDDQLREKPQLSNRWIADIAGVDHKTVGARRDHLEQGGEIPHLTEFESKDGSVQPGDKDRRPPFPWMHEPGWEEWHRAEARSYLRKMSEAEKDALSEMVTDTTAPARVCVDLLASFMQQPERRRARIVDLWETEDPASREKAKRMASGQAPLADARVAMLDGAAEYYQRAIRVVEDEITPQIRSASGTIRGIIQCIKDQASEE